MTYFAITYHYPEGDENIARVRPKHREFLRGLLDAGTLVASGPYSGGDALIIIKLDDEATVADAEALMDNDPYLLEGVLPGRDIKTWDPILNTF